MNNSVCLNCKSILQEDEKTCRECGTVISDINKQKSVVINRFHSIFEAEKTQTYLLEYGIESYIFKDDAGGMYPIHYGGFNEIRLLVLDSDAEKAYEVLESLEKGNDDMNADKDE